ncbi:MAG TPA: immunoglobulin domain-containing protein, partial [Clostridia bacterium]|nr:immunoglobulin domain-containing protein [Clostridia bacterium]
MMAKLLTVALLAGATAFAGTYNNSFDSSTITGATPNGTGTYNGATWLPVVQDGKLMLTPNVGSIYGSLILNDLDAGFPVESFNAQFQLRFGPGSGDAADGFAFVFGPDLGQNSTFGEDGPGGTSLCVAFDIYNNGGAEAPAIDVRVGSTQIAHHPMTKADMVTSKLEDVVIQLKRNATLTVLYKGQTIFTNVYLPGWSASYGLFGFGARTGGESCEMDIDNVSITTVKAPATPVVPTITAQPKSITVAEGNRATFDVGFDGTAPFTFQWTKNGTDIPDATDHTLTIGPVRFTDNNTKIGVKISNPSGSVISADATMTVTADNTPPTLAAVD